MTEQEINQYRTGAAIVALAIFAGAIAGQGPKVVEPSGYAAFGSADAGQLRVDFAAILPPEILALAGLPSQVRRHAVGHICASAVDGGLDPGGYAMPGSFVTWSTPDGTTCSPSDPALEFWVQGHPAAPFQCACSAGIPSGCFWNPPLYPSGVGAPTEAPVGRMLRPGQWSGTCVRMPCITVAGDVSPWPAECPQN